MTNIFIKKDNGLLNTKDNHWLFTEYAEYVEDLIGEEWFIPTNVELVKNIPQSAKDVVYAWHLTAEIGGSVSIWDYLYNWELSDEHLNKVLICLKNIGYVKMVKRFESAIKLSLKDPKFIKENHNPENFKGFTIHEEYSNFDIIDKDLSICFNKTLPELAGQYIRKHKRELFK